MSDEKLAEKVETHSKDISAMAVAVAEVTQIVKGVERRHDESMTAVKDAMTSIQKLFEKDVAGLKDDVNELKTEYRVLRHDLKNAENVLGVFPEMNKAITEAKTKLTSIETWKNEITGGAHASRTWVVVLWAVFGTGIMAVVAWILSAMFGGAGG